MRRKELASRHSLLGVRLEYLLAEKMGVIAVPLLMSYLSSGVQPRFFTIQLWRVMSLGPSTRICVQVQRAADVFGTTKPGLQCAPSSPCTAIAFVAQCGISFQ